MSIGNKPITLTITNGNECNNENLPKVLNKYESFLEIAPSLLVQYSNFVDSLEANNDFLNVFNCIFDGQPYPFPLRFLTCKLSYDNMSNVINYVRALSSKFSDECAKLVPNVWLAPTSLGSPTTLYDLYRAMFCKAIYNQFWTDRRRYIHLVELAFRQRFTEELQMQSGLQPLSIVPFEQEPMFSEHELRDLEEFVSFIHRPSVEPEGPECVIESYESFEDDPDFITAESEEEDEEPVFSRRQIIKQRIHASREASQSLEKIPKNENGRSSPIRRTATRSSNDKYMSGPIYGHPLLIQPYRYDQETEKRARLLWSRVTVPERDGKSPTFNLQQLRYQFRSFMQLLYNRMWYKKPHKSDPKMNYKRAISASNLLSVTYGARLPYNCSFNVKPRPAKTGVLAHWLKYYKFCLYHFCGRDNDYITELLDIGRKTDDLLVEKITSRDFLEMQTGGKNLSDTTTTTVIDEDPTTNLAKGFASFGTSIKNFFTGKVSKAKETADLLSKVTAAASGDDSAASDLVSTAISMSVRGFFAQVKEKTVNFCSTSVEDVKKWFSWLKEKILEFWNTLIETFQSSIQTIENPGFITFCSVLAALLIILLIYRWWQGETGKTILIFVAQLLCIGPLAAGCGYFVEAITQMKKDDIEMQSSDTVIYIIKAFLGALTLSNLNSTTAILARMPCIITQTRDFFKWMIDKIYYLCTKGEHYFPEYSQMEELETYIKSVQEILFENEYEIKTYLSTSKSMKVISLGEDLKEMFMRLESVKANYSPSNWTALERTLKNFSEFVDKVRVRSIVTQARITPVVVSFYGPPNHGKSTVMKFFPKLVYDRVAAIRPDYFPLKFSPNLVFTKAAGQNFWDGINIRTFCYTDDDAFQNVTQQRRAEELTEFITLISPTLKALGGASVSNKNTLFAAFPLYTYTTNATDQNFREITSIVEPNAFFRRRHFHLKVEAKNRVGKNELLDKRNEAWNLSICNDSILGNSQNGELPVIQQALEDTGISFDDLLKAPTNKLSYNIDQIADLAAKTIISRITARDELAAKLYAQTFSWSCMDPPKMPLNLGNQEEEKIVEPDNSGLTPIQEVELKIKSWISTVTRHMEKETEKVAKSALAREQDTCVEAGKAFAPLVEQLDLTMWWAENLTSCELLKSLNSLEDVNRKIVTNFLNVTRPGLIEKWVRDSMKDDSVKREFINARRQHTQKRTAAQLESEFWDDSQIYELHTKSIDVQSDIRIFLQMKYGRVALEYLKRYKPFRCTYVPKIKKEIVNWYAAYKYQEVCKKDLLVTTTVEMQTGDEDKIPSTPPESPIMLPIAQEAKSEKIRASNVRSFEDRLKALLNKHRLTSKFASYLYSWYTVEDPSKKEEAIAETLRSLYSDYTITEYDCSLTAYKQSWTSTLTSQLNGSSAAFYSLQLSSSPDDRKLYKMVHKFFGRIVCPDISVRRKFYKDIVKLSVYHDVRMDQKLEVCLTPYLMKIYVAIERYGLNIPTWEFVDLILQSIGGSCPETVTKSYNQHRESDVLRSYMQFAIVALNEDRVTVRADGVFKLPKMDWHHVLEPSTHWMIKSYNAISNFWCDLSSFVYGFYYAYRPIIISIFAFIIFFFIGYGGGLLLNYMIASISGDFAKEVIEMNSLTKGQMAKMSNLPKIRMHMQKTKRKRSKVIRTKVDEDPTLADQVKIDYMSSSTWSALSEKNKLKMQSELTVSIDNQISRIGNSVRFLAFRYPNGESYGNWATCSGRSAYLNKHFFTGYGDNWAHVSIMNGDECLQTIEKRYVVSSTDPACRDYVRLDFDKKVYAALPALDRFIVSQHEFASYLGKGKIVRLHRISYKGSVSFRYEIGESTARGPDTTRVAVVANNKQFQFKLSEHVVVTGARGEHGDCGLPYLAVDPTGAVRILGFHCASIGECALFTPLYKSDLAKEVAYIKADKTVSLAEEDVSMQTGRKPVYFQGPYIPPVVATTTTKHKHSFDGRTVSCGTIPKGDFMPSETSIRPSVFQGDAILPPIKPIDVAPALLKPTWVQVEDVPEDTPCNFVRESVDADTGETVSEILRRPLHNAVTKLKAPPVRVFPSWIFELAEREPEKLFHGFFPKDGVKPEFKMLTLKQALQYLDMSKSIGVDFKAMGYSKRSELWDLDSGYINPDLQKAVDALFVAMRAGFSLKNVVSGCLKDETRDLERVYNGKTRLFCIGSLAHLLVTIMVVGEMVSYLKSHRAWTDVCIGVNPHGREWATYAEKLKKFVRHGGGDFSGFDTSIVHAFGSLLFIFMKWFSGWTDPLMLWFLENVCVSSIAPMMVINDQLYWLDYMNSSGGWLTGFLNSFVNIVIFNSFLFLICQEHGIEFNRDALLILLIYGDDNLWSVARKIAKWFNMITLSKYIYDTFGMTYTTPQKGDVSSPFIPFEELEFLCRRFVDIGGLYKAPLSEDSINGMLLWIKKSELVSPKQQLSINVEQAMMEFYHYGEDRFLEEQELLQKYCSHFGVQYTGRTYDHYHERWVRAQVESH